jgi:hypothetical protein
MFQTIVTEQPLTAIAALTAGQFVVVKVLRFQKRRISPGCLLISMEYRKCAQ